MRATARLVETLLTTSAIVALAQPGAPAAAQSSGSTGTPKFDMTRFVGSEGRFETFHVTRTQPLRQALDGGVLEDDTRVLVTETAVGRLALLTDQMAYHHIAQGIAAGREWMVTF